MAEPRVYSATKDAIDTQPVDYLDSLQKLGLTPKDSVTIKDPVTGAHRKVKGRFLHITDMHPDPYYKEGSDITGYQVCHGGKGAASKYGDAFGGCDSPMVLMNDTIQWVNDNLKDKIDFVIWTGDNIRHDNDRRFPRLEMHILEMNQQVSDLMYTTFKNEKNLADPRDMSVDIIPSLGNNDVYPHNLFAPGPTLQTREFYKIWSPFVPQSQLHTFNKGAYFFQEVVPGKLAVLSINTLYWFQSNPLVDSCDRKKDPGYALFLWLGAVLKELRSRDMKVWLSGHVPPNEKNYDISCLRKYIIWSHEFRDIIIGGVYGHMNIDHFIPLDLKAAYKSLMGKYVSSKGVQDSDFDEFEIDIESDSDSEYDLEDDFDRSLEDFYQQWNVTIFNDSLDEASDGEFYDPQFSIQGGVPYGKVNYLDNLREIYYAAIKKSKKSGINGERYSIAHVTASVVPTFNPGLRVWEYNITELADSINTEQIQYAPWDEFFSGVDAFVELQREDEDEDIETPITAKGNANILKKDKTIPKKMPKNLPLGPGYIPQLFTPERYVQYYADLKSINEGSKEFGYEIEYVTDDKKLYDMENLTVEEWLKFGRKLGKPVKAKTEEKKKSKGKKDKGDKKKNKEVLKLENLWKHYLKYSFVNSNYEEMDLSKR